MGLTTQYQNTIWDLRIHPKGSLLMTQWFLLLIPVPLLANSNLLSFRPLANSDLSSSPPPSALSPKHIPYVFFLDGMIVGRHLLVVAEVLWVGALTRSGLLILKWGLTRAEAQSIEVLLVLIS